MSRFAPLRLLPPQPFHNLPLGLAFAWLACCVCWTAPALGQKKDAQLQYPIDVAVGESGVFLADRSLPGVWQVEDGKASLYFQGQKTFRTPLNAIRCLAVDKDGRLLAGDSSTRNVYRFDDKGTPKKLLTNRIGVGLPMALAIDKEGRILIADLEQHQILVVDAKGGEPKQFAAVRAPRGLAVDSEGNVWVVSHAKNQLLRISTDGKKQTVVVENGPFQFPHHVALDKNNVAYIADGFGKTIWKVAADGKPEAMAQGEPLDNPVGLAWHDGKLYVADSRATNLFTVDADGKVTPLLKQP